MQLEELVKNIEFRASHLPLSDCEINAITSDSRKVIKGSLFIALKGEQLNGHDFIDAAIKNGAAAVVAMASYLSGKKVNLDNRVPVLLVDDSRKILGHLAARWFEYPSQKLRVIGVTGTNGKTTTTNLLSRLLEPLGSAAVLGTVELRIGDYAAPASMTTPDPCVLHGYFQDMLNRGALYCAMEVSSHALAQHRVTGVDFRSAIFTNLTQDHLDYHKTLAAYFDCKSRLFREFPLANGAVINIDDSYGRKLLKISSASISTYGFSPDAMFHAESPVLTLNETKFLFTCPQFQTEITLPLSGGHNIYNFLAAASVALNEGISKQQLLEQTAKLQAPCGRLEEIKGDWPFKIFVDYAHSPDAMERILSFLRSAGKGRLISVFGCGGDRDRTKRPLMGCVAGKFSDFVVLTSDNPRSENPVSILKDIKKGMNGERAGKIVEILDRHDAIQYALNAAGEGDIVAILGKGHECVQIIGEKRIPFSDQTTVREIMKEHRLVSH